MNFCNTNSIFNKPSFDDNTVFRFLVDMLDSAIISVTRFLGGRRLSRQLELISPVASLAEPVIGALSLIPRSYYGK